MDIIGRPGFDFINLAGSRLPNKVYANGLFDSYDNKGDNLIIGGRAGDTLIGGFGRDVIFGGGGDDTIVGYGAVQQGSPQSWGIPPGHDDRNILDGGAGNDVIRSGHADDIIHGGTGDDVIQAYGGDDRISGGSGNDTIHSGLGDDTIWGGAGADRFVYEIDLRGIGEGGHDRIMDFKSGVDRIDVSGFLTREEEMTITETGNGLMLSFTEYLYVNQIELVGVHSLAAGDIIYTG